MATNDGYMLQRDTQESQRLNAQHDFFVSLSHGHLVHPSIPCKGLRAVADVGTGTGVWLRDVAASSAFSSRKTEFVGFDISSQQFPSVDELPSNVDLITQDVTKPFGPEYHEKFDLVSIRLLGYVIKVVDLEKIVHHIVQILRPGGYLQWLECDACDIWATPETPMTTAMSNYVISERVARGLLPAIATPLAKTIQSFSVQIPDDHLNPISWSPELMRLTRLETISTKNHPSPAVAASKKLAVLSAAVALLEASVSRVKSMAADPLLPSLQVERLVKKTESITELVEAIKRGEDDACNNWEMEMIWIVARKAIIVNENESWMSVKYPV